MRSSKGGSNPGSGGSGGGRGTTKQPTGNATRLLNEWTGCMRRNGDPNQADPTIDAHGVINVNIPTDAQSLANQVHGGSGPCSRYLAAASNALRAADPVAPPPDRTQILAYSKCMRTNGVPDYPDPNFSTGTVDLSNVNTNSPAFLRTNRVCGRQIGAPAWWISGTGPPGDVVVSSGPVPGGPGPSPPAVNGG